MNLLANYLEGAVISANSKKKKVGLPRALIFYKFSSLWETFFRELGIEVVISPKTTKKIKELGISYAPDEDCYSTKLYFGHVLALKDEVDFLFIPRFGSTHKTNSGCPKFIGLADVLRSMFPDLPEIIRPYFSTAKAGHGKFYLIKTAFRIGFKFTKNPFKIVLAIIKASKNYQKHNSELILTESNFQNWEQLDSKKNQFPERIDHDNPIRIALVGHSYVLNDPLASINIRSILKKSNIEIITSEQMPRKIIENQMAKLEYNLYFDFTREILGTIMYFLESKTIDGIIQLIIFSCGPDSIAGEMAAKFAKQNPDVPFLQIVIDELTADAGVKTRVEAFIDLIRRRKEKLNEGKMGAFEKKIVIENIIAI